MIQFALWGLILISSLSCEFAYARTFNFKSESFATYFGGTFGTSNVANTAFEKSFPSGVTGDKTVPWNTSGEFGFLIAGARANFRLGGEILMPRELSDITGTSGSTSYFSLTSSVQGLVASAFLEFLAHQTATSRMIFGAGYGLAFVTVTNSYKMTTDGTTATGLSDFKEAGHTQAPILQASVGYETLLTDTTTVAFSLGYRHCEVSELKAGENSSGFGGSQAEGSTLLNTDGSRRGLSLSGMSIGFNFRFYL